LPLASSPLSSLNHTNSSSISTTPNSITNLHHLVTIKSTKQDTYTYTSIKTDQMFSSAPPHIQLFKFKALAFRASTHSSIN
jgi:hypothetical protein